MKIKLLRKLRKIGRNKITIHSITTTDGCTTGLSYGYSGSEYKNLFNFGDTKEEIYRKAERIYINTNIDKIRKKYKK